MDIDAIRVVVERSLEVEAAKRDKLALEEVADSDPSMGLNLYSSLSHPPRLVDCQLADYDRVQTYFNYSKERKSA